MKIQQFPGQSFDDQNSSMNLSNNFVVETKMSKNSGTSLISQQFSDMQICPARSEEKLIIQGEDIVEDFNSNPWAVKQTDSLQNHSEVAT